MRSGNGDRFDTPTSAILIRLKSLKQEEDDIHPKPAARSPLIAALSMQAIIPQR
jgi:hypothetical protein